MENTNQTRRRFTVKMARKQEKTNSIPALLGQGNGTVVVPNQSGMVYYRAGNEEAPGTVFNNRVPLSDNLPIFVGYDPIVDPDRRLFQVLSIRQTAYVDAGNAPVPQVGPHHATHEYGGGDDVYVEWRRLMGLRVGRPVAFVVEVDWGYIFRGGVWLQAPVGATTVDLTAEQAALVGTQAQMILISLDSTGAIAQTNGVIVASPAALTIANCPTPPVGNIPLAAIRIYATQTAIGDTPSAPDIIDLRFPTYSAMGTHSILSVTHDDTTPAACVRGDIITGQVGPVWARLALGGAAGSFVRRDATDPGWSTLILPNAATTGDLLVATGANTIGVLAAGATAGHVLTSNGAGAAPSWQAIPAQAHNSLTGLQGGTAGEYYHMTSAYNTLLTAGATAGYVFMANGVGSAPSWQANPAAGWGLTGNAGTTPGTNFVGTTDDVNFVVKTNGVERLQVLIPLTTQRTKSYNTTLSIGGEGLFSANNSNAYLSSIWYDPGSFAFQAAALSFNLRPSGAGGLAVTDSLAASGAVTLQSIGGNMYFSVITKPQGGSTYYPLQIIDNDIFVSGTIASSLNITPPGYSPQLKIGYDVSNYMTATVSSAGAVTFAATGASAGFAFSQAVTFADNVTLTTAKWLGLGAAAGRLTFTDAATDTVVFSDCNVGIGISPLAKLHSYEVTALGGTTTNSQILQLISGKAGSDGNTIYNAKYLIRDATGTGWATARLHDSVRVDNSYTTPRTDTRTWWERDPADDIQEWGTGASSYMILKVGNVGIGTATPTAKLQVVGLATYANNAAAVAAGLTAGAFYRSNGDPDLVCVVH